MVHDIEDQFRLVWLKQEDGLKPSKDGFKSHLKSSFCLSLYNVANSTNLFTFPAYLKKVMKKLEEIGAPAESIAEFKAGAPAAMKKILANYDNYDVLMGQSMDGDAMYVSIDIY